MPGCPAPALSYRSKLGTHGSWLGVVLLVGGLAFWAGKHAMSGAPEAKSLPAAAASEAMGASPAAAAGIRYVHRGGSALRDAPKASGHTLKKESKGAQVTLLSEDGGWAKVTDGNITGYMRASVLGADPPR
jgi:Bacterial SH3 domain